MMASLANAAFVPRSSIRYRARFKLLNPQRWRSSKISAPILRNLSAISCCSRSYRVGAASYFRQSEIFGSDEEESEAAGLIDNLRAGFGVLLTVLPGGSWWSLDRIVFEATKKKDGGAGKDVSVLFALRRMWKLVATDGWIIYGGFASLLIAADESWHAHVKEINQIHDGKIWEEQRRNCELMQQILQQLQSNKISSSTPAHSDADPNQEKPTQVPSSDIHVDSSRCMRKLELPVFRG